MPGYVKITLNSYITLGVFSERECLPVAQYIISHANVTGGSTWQLSYIHTCSGPSVPLQLGSSLDLLFGDRG